MSLFDDLVDINIPLTNWRDHVNHDSPKAKRIKRAVAAIHARNEYPGCRRVMHEIGEEVWKNKMMNGRDNVVRRRAMKELGISVEDNPMDDGGYEDNWSYGY